LLVAWSSIHYNCGATDFYTYGSQLLEKKQEVMVINMGLLGRYNYPQGSKPRGVFIFGVYWLAIEFYSKVIKK